MVLKVYEFLYNGLFKYRNRRNGVKIMFDGRYFTCSPIEIDTLKKLEVRYKVHNLTIPENEKSVDTTEPVVETDTSETEKENKGGERNEEKQKDGNKKKETTNKADKKKALKRKPIKDRV